MHIGTDHVFRESIAALLLIVVLLAVAWRLTTRARTWSMAVFVVTAGAFLWLGDVVGDVRPGELMIVVACALIPATALVRERLQPGTLPRGARGLVGVFGPVVLLSWLMTRAFVLPSIACARHLVEHAEVHQRWALEYRALLELEDKRAERHVASRFRVDDIDLPPASDVELIEATGPNGGWAYSATPRGCPGCRSFYLDSNDTIRSARRRRATASDAPVHDDELVFLRYLLDHGCLVMGDVQCR